ncbi:MAG: hypothetical protein V1885_00160 [Candidatus Brennerbacteria bacterium]
MKTKTWMWTIGIVVVLGALFMYPRLNGGKAGSGIGSGVPCLVPNVSLVQHIHPVLTITVDGVREEIPANIGLAECERAVHTHDDDAAQGIIHVESQDRRSYVLGDFFGVWGKSLVREGYALTATADGEAATDTATIVFKDGQDIRLNYQSVTATP